MCIKFDFQKMLKYNAKNSGGIMRGVNRKDIFIGQEVNIVLKKDQPTGKLTYGRVKRILTNSPHHHRGIKVMLEDGQVGRVQFCKEKEKENGN